MRGLPFAPSAGTSRVRARAATSSGVGARYAPGTRARRSTVALPVAPQHIGRAARVAAAFAPASPRGNACPQRCRCVARSRRAPSSSSRATAAFLAVGLDVRGQLRQPGFAPRQHAADKRDEFAHIVVEVRRAVSRRPRDRARAVAAGAAAGARPPARTACVPSSSTPSPAPMPDSTGRRRASDWLSASIVSRRRRLGFSQQAPAALRVDRAARVRASARVRGASCDGADPSAQWRSASRMRLRISAAALRVNVMASSDSGRSTTASNARKRCVSSSVLPEPAGACTMKLRVTSSAVSRACASSCSSSLGCIVGLLGPSRNACARAAQARQMAVAAGLRRVRAPAAHRPPRVRARAHRADGCHRCSRSSQSA